MNMVVTGYQVWSTVLGSSLTSIKPTGEKLITKVFAGGAVIAKQSHSGANWITSDPVTGTEGAYIDNEHGRISTTTEHEPLGQEIFQFDPSDEISDPPPNEIVSYSEGMQWQCEIPQSFYGSFEQMPFHCQIARYNNPNLREEESPSHIDEESPTPGQEPVPEENTPTEKPQAEAGGRDANAGGSAGDGGVPASSKPTLKPQKTKSKPTIRPRRTKAERDAAREAAAANPVGVDEGDPHYSSRSSGSLDMSVPGFEAAEHSTGSRIRRRRRTNWADVKKCLTNMGLTISNYSQSTKGNNGHVTVSGNNADGKHISKKITNDITSFNSAELRTISDGWNPDFTHQVRGLTIGKYGYLKLDARTSKTSVTEIRRSVSPEVNYTASDTETTDFARFAVQVHELGNSIKAIWGRSHFVTPEIKKLHADGDAGAGLSQCVFGGFVTKDGVVVTSLPK